MKGLSIICASLMVLALLTSCGDLIPSDFNINADIQTTSDLGQDTLDRIDEVNDTLNSGIEVGPETRGTIEELNDTIANGIKAGFDDETLARVDELLRTVEDGLKIGLDDETLNSLDGMVNTIDEMPGNWENSTTNIIQTLESSAGSAAKQMADEVEGVLEETRYNYQQMTMVTGVEFRCNVDFLGSKVGATAQEFIGKSIVGKLRNILSGNAAENKIPTPWVCQISPDVMELSKVGERLVFEKGVINLTGYNFTQENSPSAQIVDEGGNLVSGFNLFPYMTSPYQIQLNVQDMDLSQVPARARLVFSWPNVAATSGVAILMPGHNAPVASFAMDKSSGFAPLTVQFTDTSAGDPTSWEWVFGDGSTSLEQNPSHVFNEENDFQVMLTVTNSIGQSSVSQTISVGTELAADFTFSPQNGEVGQTVVFKDTSEGNPSSWYWDFGDGSTSNEQNPMHLYMNPNPDGYTVTLTVQNGNSSSTKTSTDRIEIVSKVVPEFSANKTSGQPPLTVIFSNQSTGQESIAGYLWDFGDGSETSSEVSPTHTYTTNGKFTVTLTVIRTDGEQLQEMKDAYISAAKFTFIPRTFTKMMTTIADKSVYFTSFSIGAGGTNYDTEISYDKYVCGVNGFVATNGVISWGHNNRDGLRVYMYPQNSPSANQLTWWILAEFEDLSIHNYPKENWTVNTICFDRTLENSTFLYRDDFRNISGGTALDTGISTADYFNCGVAGINSHGATGYVSAAQYPVVAEADLVKGAASWVINSDMDVYQGGDFWDIKAICLKKGGEDPAQKPNFLSKTVTLPAGTTSISTGISVADYACGVNGFKAANGDLNTISPMEQAASFGLPKFMYINNPVIAVQTYPSSGTWFVQADIASYIYPESWTVNLFCVKRPIAAEGTPPD